jgi:abortive infection bacteriophage resistance protein
MSHPVKPYTKPARDPAALIAHLTARGLTIPNVALATHALERIGYYRLLIYMRPLQDPTTKNFLAGTTFEQIVDLYNFDRELRLHCLDAIERIEVAVRSAVINELSVRYGAHFHLERRHFEDKDGYRGFMNESIKARYLGITHYYDNYNDPSIPPIWTILEGVTLGTLSRMFSQLHLTNRRLISQRFNYPEPTMVSWVRSLNNLRNACAHHNRLWNAVMQVDQPMKHKSLRGEWGTNQNRFYARAVVMVALLHRIDSTLTWKQELKALFAKYPAVQPSQLGFPVGWDTRTFWT